SGYAASSNTPGGIITIPSRGQGSAGHVGYQGKPFWCGPLCYRVNSKVPEIKNRFLFHFLKNIQNELVDLRKTGSIPAVNKRDLARVKVPIIDPREQETSINLLDKLDALVNDLSSGLPAEIAA